MSFRFQRIARHSPGFSLAEVLIALFILTVGILGVMATLFWATRNSDSGKVVTEATSLARTISETIRLRGVAYPFPTEYNDAVTVRKAITAPPFNSLVNEVYLDSIKGQGGTSGAQDMQSNLDRFQRNISLKQVTTASDSHLAKMCQLTVKIYWKEKERERHVSLDSLIPLKID